MLSELDSLITIAWLSSAAWVGMMIVAYLLHRAHGQTALRKDLIVQITTIGDDIVNETISALKAMRDPPEVWVINEVSDTNAYPHADRVITVPADFKTSQGTEKKGRALEYARRFRLGLGRTGYRVLLLDDDAIPSESFVRECQGRKFDLLQGLVISSPRRHDVLSYLDAAMRSCSCLSICSFFQELGKPLWTHGEGFCIDEAIDRAVSWNIPGWHGEDLLYGIQATRKYGFRMASTYAVVVTNAPMSVKDFVSQRRRWTWAQFWVFRHLRSLIPWSTRLQILGFWTLGVLITPIALAGTVLATLNLYHLPEPFAAASVGLLSLWLGMWAVSGYFGSRSVTGTLTSVVASFVAPLIYFALTVAGIVLGPAKTFEHIRR